MKKLFAVLALCTFLGATTASASILSDISVKIEKKVECEKDCKKKCCADKAKADKTASAENATETKGTEAKAGCDKSAKKACCAHKASAKADKIETAEEEKSEATTEVQ